MEPRPGGQHTLKWLGACQVPIPPPADEPRTPKTKGKRESYGSTAE